MDNMLQEQLEYYRARAPEFDASVGASSPPPGSHLVQQMGPFQQVLELACGTGIWTEVLLPIGVEITALDASPEMIEVNRRRVASARVRYQLADLFAWEPDHRYDLVFFAAWLSHVPPNGLDAFLDKVRRAVRLGGSLVIVDQHALKEEDQRARTDSIYVTRHLSDGRSFTLVKVCYDPEVLADRLAYLGFEAAIHTLDNVWFLLSARRRE